jgi:hypothetical protein
MSEKRYKLNRLSVESWKHIAGGVGESYTRIARLMEEEVLSNEEFEFWTEATYILLDAAKKLDALAARADG